MRSLLLQELHVIIKRKHMVNTHWSTTYIKLHAEVKQTLHVKHITVSYRFNQNSNDTHQP